MCHLAQLIFLFGENQNVSGQSQSLPESGYGHTLTRFNECLSGARRKLPETAAGGDVIPATLTVN